MTPVHRDPSGPASSGERPAATPIVPSGDGTCGDRTCGDDDRTGWRPAHRARAQPGFVARWSASVSTADAGQAHGSRGALARPPGRHLHAPPRADLPFGGGPHGARSCSRRADRNRSLPCAWRGPPGAGRGGTCGGAVRQLVQSSVPAGHAAADRGGRWATGTVRPGVLSPAALAESPRARARRCLRSRGCPRTATGPGARRSRPRRAATRRGSLSTRRGEAACR